MNWWGGSKEDSQAQAGSRNQRAARRAIRSLDIPEDDSSSDYEDCNLSNSFICNVDGQDDLSEVETDANNSIMAEKFEDEKGTDDTDYFKKLGSLSKRTFNTKEVEFWFTSFETSVKHIGVKSQWAKREVLHSLLPDDVQIAVKHILKKGQDAAGDTPYKALKQELIKLYAPKPEAAFERALSRKLATSGTPSNLAKLIIDDLCICASPLSSKCCQRTIWGMWIRELPVVIRQRFAGQTFNNSTYEGMLELADALYLTMPSQSTSSVAAVSTAGASSTLDETLPALPYAVNAASRGQNRGGRGQRGSQQASTNSSSGRGNRRGRGSNNASRGGNRWPTTRHADLPAGNQEYCFNHHTHGRQAFFCSDPLTCTWANIPPHPRPKPVQK